MGTEFLNRSHLFWTSTSTSTLLTLTQTFMEYCHVKLQQLHQKVKKMILKRYFFFFFFTIYPCLYP